jgi:hypothetical protein
MSTTHLPTLAEFLLGFTEILWQARDEGPLCAYTCDLMYGGLIVRDVRTGQLRKTDGGHPVEALINFYNIVMPKLKMREQA